MGQYSRVKKVLEETLVPLALHQIHDEIRHRFAVLDSEAGISARIRDIRRHLELNGLGTIHSQRVEGKAYHRYRVIAAAASDLPQASLFAG